MPQLRLGTGWTWRLGCAQGVERRVGKSKSSEQSEPVRTRRHIFVERVISITVFVTEFYETSILSPVMKITRSDRNSQVHIRKNSTRVRFELGQAWWWE